MNRKLLNSAKVMIACCGLIAAVAIVSSCNKASAPAQDPRLHQPPQAARDGAESKGLSAPVSGERVESLAPIAGQPLAKSMELSSQSAGVPGAAQPAAPADAIGDGRYRQDFNTETYDRIFENTFLDVVNNPLSTFSIDVDTASYSNMRRFLNTGSLPPPDAVRIEELVNYFPYDYPPPEGDVPFSASTEVGQCPWAPDHWLVRIGLQGRPLAEDKLPGRNLVFLLDVSGSMNTPDKLPLLKQAMRLLTQTLSADDRIAAVVYAGAAGLVLPSTPGDQQEKILSALEQLSAGGSTNGGHGIQLAYSVARENFIKDGINRVILATDGDFNIGVTNQGELIRLIEDERKSGVFLTVLGFGQGNLKDSTMEKLADTGNGNYAYIDSIHEARKVLVNEAGGTLVTIAKDVKIQVEFNPVKVAAYRLIGYENRLLRNEDFNDDTKDAGEIGAGHRVTALYELVPVGEPVPDTNVDELKYQSSRQTTDAAFADELMTVKLRYKEPTSDTSQLLSFPVTGPISKLADTTSDFQWAAAVAGFGMVLRQSGHKGNATFDGMYELAQGAAASDEGGYRQEFLKLVDTARKLSAR